MKQKDDFAYSAHEFPPLTKDTLNDIGVENLCTAIVADAAKQWRRCVRMITVNPSRTVYAEKKRIEQFFLSDTFLWMGCGLDGRELIRMLEQESGISKLSPEEKRKYDANYMLRRMSDPARSYYNKMYNQKKKGEKNDG